MWIGATSLFRAAAAGLILLAVLVLSVTSAQACSDDREADAMVPGGIGSSMLRPAGAAVATAAAVAAEPVGWQDMDGAGDPKGCRTGHCPCCSSHGPGSASGIVSPLAADFPSPCASSPPRAAFDSPRCGLPVSPGERPPRLT